MASFRFTHQGVSVTPEDFMARRRIGGWIVLKNGEVATERYGMGNVQSSRWVSFSVAKSVTSTLVGAALHDGSLDSLDRRCETLLPALRGGGYEGTTVRQLLRMTSGVRWSEEYTDPNSDIGRFGDAVRLNRPGAVLDFVRARPRANVPGTVFNYNTGDTFVLGALVAAATGMTLSGYLSARIWSRTGMEADGYWMVEAPDGQELAGGALCATLRDYARFGLFVLRDGVVGAQRLLPEGWRDLAGGSEGGSYGYQWWRLGAGAFEGRGLYGQFLSVHPAENIVSVIWGAGLRPIDGAADEEAMSLLAGVVDFLR